MCGFMAKRSLRILQVSTMDTLGGAEKVAWELFRSYRDRGYASWLAVGHMYGNDPDVLLLPNHETNGGWPHFWWGMHGRLKSVEERLRGVWRLRRLTRWLAEAAKELDIYRGVEDFHFPGTRRLLTLAQRVPDIVHCHNLHGGYFDLRVLPWLTRHAPVVLTLHDAWLLSGHCAHSFDCERWKTGCGHCPDLTIYPAIRRDATAHNWQRKRAIYSRTQLYVATPSRWLMQKVKHSILAPNIVAARIIPNGVDLSVFHPTEKAGVRALLGIPRHAKVLLFTANGIRRNIWKDYETMRAAVGMVADRLQDQDILFIALGEDSPAERIGRAEVRFVPYQRDPEVVARHYQAADAYVHAARADTFPQTVLEALACGTPVVATAVGGIPEQVKGLGIFDSGTWNTHLNTYEMNEATGALVPQGNVEALARAITMLLADDGLRSVLGGNAAKDARQRFDLERQVSDYLSWYEELIARRELVRSEIHAD